MPGMTKRGPRSNTGCGRSRTLSIACRRRGDAECDRVAGLLEFALSEPEIMCELIADGHHVSTTLMKMLYRAKGSARNLSGDGCHRRRRFAERVALHARPDAIAW